MKALVLSVAESELRKRHASGADRWDEMWGGVLHMPPPPDFDHQDIVTSFAYLLKDECRHRSGGKVAVQAGLYAPEDPEGEYRVPDLIYVAEGHEKLIRKRGVFGPASARS